MKVNVYEYPTDTALLPAYRIAVMQAAMDGATVEAKPNGSKQWEIFTLPQWDWTCFNYRIAKPAARYFRNRNGLFGPMHDFNEMYCIEIDGAGVGWYVHGNGRRQVSGTEGTIMYKLESALRCVELGDYVEFDGNMEPFRPEPKEPAKPTTIMGWLLTLPKPYRMLAIKVLPECNADKPCKDMSDALGYGFGWKSEPGVLFWRDVWSFYTYAPSAGFKLPPVPQPKKLVPWTQQTCPPLGTWLRCGGEDGTWRWLLISIDWLGCSGFNPTEAITYKKLMESGAEYSTDQGKTWSSCGTEE